MTLKLSHRRIDQGEITYPQILRVRDYIEAKRGDRPFAARRDILPEDIAFALGRVIIMDVRHDPLDFVYRLYGSEISTGDHDEVTKKSVFDQNPGPYRDSLLGCYSEAVAVRAPTFHEMTVGDGRRSARYQRGLFPLSDDGRTINMLLSVTWWSSDLNTIWDEFLAQG
jgi:hypothetical protein